MMSDIPGIDTTVANVARIYDCLLGGKDNFEADRAAAARITELIPGSAEACRLNREFLVRVVTHLARQGVRQFLDLGSGLPTRLNVHQVARHANGDSRVVYVDYDRVAVLHAQAILNDGEWVAAIEGDIRDPADIVAKAAGTGLIDFTEPVGVLMFAILHFIPDDDKPREIIGAFMDAVPPLSCLALSHVTGDAVGPETSEAAQRVYKEASAAVIPRTRDQVAGLLGGLEMIGPGLTDINDWPASTVHSGKPAVFYGGVGVKPGAGVRGARA
jgi:S-adenosyl methyltransferase